MLYRIEITPLTADARGHAVESQAATFLDLPGITVRSRDVYTLAVDLSEADAERVMAAFSNPVIQRSVLGETTDVACDWLLIVGYLPGVTDNVARSARAAIHDVVGRPLREDEAVYSSVEYLLSGPGLTRESVAALAEELLANSLINSITVLSHYEMERNGIPDNVPVFQAVAEPTVNHVNLAVDDAGLQAISSEGTLALTLAEMQAIQAYYLDPAVAAAREALGLQAQPTDAELEVLAQTWSEHCKHKIFAAEVDYTDTTTGEQQTIVSLYKSYIQRATKEIGERVPWLRSVFTDNAGVIAFNDTVDLVYKVETHNSPSALDPYGGAMTGIVGVNRDPMGTGLGANLLVNVWGYCLASPYTAREDVPEGLLHPRRIRDGVHRGVIEGGNQSGIPYGYGWEYFDARFLGKPLVFCGTIGTLPKLLQGEPGYEKSIKPGDLVVMAGGRIGKDGIHGATFSSEELHADSPAQAVQIGDPITQKKLSDFIYEARDRGLYRFITDNGAGGLSSSIGEMATNVGGCRMDMQKAPLKYQGLQPWEILLSEAQERMSFAVPPEHIAEFQAMAAAREVEVSVLGEFTDSGFFHVTYGEQTIAYLTMDFLHDGCPRLKLPAVWEPPAWPEPDELPDDDLGELVCRLLGRLNVCSDEPKARQYDHEVKALSVVKPFIGVANDVASDATVFMVEPCGTDGIVVTAAALPRYADIDTYHMVASVIDLCIRRTLAVGGQLGHIAGLDNFCWPDPVLSDKTPDGAYKMAQLVRANQALYDTCTAFDLPCISGKDSMKNDSTRGGQKISIPPTLLFSTVARMEDISKAVTLEAKRVGDLVYVVGQTHAELGGSEYFDMLGYVGTSVPRVDIAQAKALYIALAAATDRGLCHSVHTPALGGLGVAFAKIAMGGRLGLDIDVAAIPADPDLLEAEILFSESNSRFVVTVARRQAPEFEALFAGLPCAAVGQVKYDPALTFYATDAFLAEAAVDDLTEAYSITLRD